MHKAKLRLGVNIDHVATLRNARGGAHPCPAHAARLAQDAGADGITLHLREDRRHIRDADLAAIRAATSLPLNLEMAATTEMLAIALNFKPNAVCLVPERREELTTEGGLDVARLHDHLLPIIQPLKHAGIRVSLFIDPSPKHIEAAHRLEADIVELHTGAYAHAAPDNAAHIAAMQHSATLAHEAGLEVHAGHGLTYDNVSAIAALPEVKELNIGHFLIGEAMFRGLKPAIQTMRAMMDKARNP